MKTETDREKLIDKEMISNLKKSLPTSDSQNKREIDAITKPSTRAQQRKAIDPMFCLDIKHNMEDATAILGNDKGGRPPTTGFWDDLIKVADGSAENVSDFTFPQSAF